MTAGPRRAPRPRTCWPPTASPRSRSPASLGPGSALGRRRRGARSSLWRGHLRERLAGRRRGLGGTLAGADGGGVVRGPGLPGGHRARRPRAPAAVPGASPGSTRCASPADARVVAFLVFFMLVAACSASFGVGFLFVFLAYLLLATWLLLLQHVLAEAEAGARPGGRRRRGAARQRARRSSSSPSPRPSRRWPITAILFFVIPRVGLAALPFRGRVGPLVTGFSDRVELGSYGQIQTDETVAMRVHVPEGTPAPDTIPDLRWRGHRLRRVRRPGVDGGRARAADAAARGRRAGRLPARRPRGPRPRAVPRGLPRADRHRRDLRGRRACCASRSAPSSSPWTTWGASRWRRPRRAFTTSSSRSWATGRWCSRRGRARGPPSADPAFAALSRAAAARAPRARPRPRGGGRRRERLRGGGAGSRSTSPASIATRSRWSARPSSIPSRSSCSCGGRATASTSRPRSPSCCGRWAFPRAWWAASSAASGTRTAGTSPCACATRTRGWRPTSRRGLGVLDPTPRAEAEAAWSPGQWSLYLDALRMRWYRYVINWSLRDQVEMAATVRRQTTQWRLSLGALPSWRDLSARGSRRRGRRRAARGRRLDVAPRGRPPGERSRPPSPTLLRARALVAGPPRPRARARRDRPRVRLPRLILGARVRPPVRRSHRRLRALPLRPRAPRRPRTWPPPNPTLPRLSQRRWSRAADRRSAKSDLRRASVDSPRAVQAALMVRRTGGEDVGTDEVTGPCSRPAGATVPSARPDGAQLASRASGSCAGVASLRPPGLPPPGRPRPSAPAGRRSTQAQASGEPAVLDQEAAVLDDLDARARQLLGRAVVADAELEPDHARPRGEQVGDVRRHVVRTGGTR